MLPDPERFLYGINLITGPGAGCGKTMFAKAIAVSLRNAGHRFALISVGLEGTGGVRGNHGATGNQTNNDSFAAEIRHGKSQMIVNAGEVFVTSAAFMESSTCLPEILDVLPGSSALGRLVIARASRCGSAILAGPEQNEYLSWATKRILDEKWAATIIVDGALNRITQAASLRSARLFYAVRAGRSDYLSVARKMRHLHHIAGLPHIDELADNSGSGNKIFHVEGPLTPSTLGAVPGEARIIVVRDFSKIFLDEAEMALLERKRKLALGAKVEFGGFSVVLRNLSREEFMDALGGALSDRVISWNAYAWKPEQVSQMA